MSIGLLLPAITAMPCRAQTQAMAEHEHAKTPLSNGLTLTIDGKTTMLTVADLQALPQRIVTVHDEHTKADEIYSGVPLGDLLAKYGFAVDKTTQRKMLHSYLIATGMDKYWVLYSATEVETPEHIGDVLVSLAKNGRPLGDDGLLKLVSSEDRKPQRWVRILTAITLKPAE